MKLRLLIAAVLLVATGYVLQLCFWGMNQSSDVGYIGGTLGLVLWCFVVAIVGKYIFRKKVKREEQAN